MTVTVLVEAPIKSGNLEKLKATLADALPETRTKDGCQSVTANFDADGTTLVLIQHWDSQAQYEKYLAWRTETGFLGEVVSMLDGQPSIRFFAPLE